jgi:hypothetical protein
MMKLVMVALVFAALLYGMVAWSLARFGREQRYGGEHDPRPAPLRDLIPALAYAGVLELAAGLAVLLTLALVVILVRLMRLGAPAA